MMCQFFETNLDDEGLELLNYFSLLKLLLMPLNRKILHSLGDDVPLCISQ